VNIFVGNIAFTVTDQDLRQLFELYGVVDTIEVITDRETGCSLGFGFVNMSERSAARAAIAGLHGTDLAGCAFTVNEANWWAVRPCAKLIPLVGSTLPIDEHTERVLVD
jgi:RNA recognition motif-containing protein